MDVNAVYIFDAPVDKVWKVLLDPDTIANCLPGCEQLTPLNDGQYEAHLTIAVGAIRGKYKAKVTLADLNPNQSYTLTIEGNGTPGFVKGQAHIALNEISDKTHVTVEGHAQVGGIIARVGQRLMSGMNKMMMDKFFSCMQEKV